MNNSSPAIEMQSVQKVYFTNKISYTAIKEISLKVKRSEFVSIVGPSGCGKTTLLDMMGTLDTPTRGKILIDGVNISTLNDENLSILRNEKIGFIFQSYNLVSYLSVLDNVTLALMVNGNIAPEKLERAKSMLSQIGLGDKLAKKPTELSGGEQQRVAIIRALVNHPPIILADEPTGNLDSKNSEIVLNLLITLAREQGSTIVIVTHDKAVAALSEREIHVRDGTIEKEVVHKNTKRKSARILKKVN